MTLDWAAPLLASAFTLFGLPVSWAELLGSVLGLAMVGFNLRVNPLGWPLAIASSLLYVVVFAHGKLYGEAGLQIVFAVLAAWGWTQWLRGRGAGGAPLAVHRLQRRFWPWVLGATLLMWLAIALLLRGHTDSPTPWLDALATAASITGQVLLARKLIENWPTWLAVNLFSAGLFAYKGLPLTTGLYLVFAALSVLGWRAWQARMGDTPNAPLP